MDKALFDEVLDDYGALTRKMKPWRQDDATRDLHRRGTGFRRQLGRRGPHRNLDRVVT